MGKPALCATAMLRCSFGMAPSTLMVLPRKALDTMKPGGNIMDNKPFLNILPFGLCRSLANPTVAAATAANRGVLTPMPCIPNTPAPWTPGNPKVMINNLPAITQSSKLFCMWGGVISVIHPGEFKFIT